MSSKCCFSKTIIDALIATHNEHNNIHDHTRNIASGLRLIQHYLSENNIEKIEPVLTDIATTIQELDTTSERLYHSSKAISHYIESIL